MTSDGRMCHSLGEANRNTRKERGKITPRNDEGTWFSPINGLTLKKKKVLGKRKDRLVGMQRKKSVLEPNVAPGLRW